MESKRRGNTKVSERSILKGEINSAKKSLTYAEDSINWFLEYGGDSSYGSVLKSSIRAIRSAIETIDKAKEYISNT
nr:MAG TPA: hypothetical protein [Caudoviricetes sp.]